MEKTHDFTTGGILGPLISFAVPVLFALFLQAMYGAVDLLIVGQYGSTADVSAVATGSQLMMTVTTVVCGLAMGLTVLLGQRIGEGRRDVAGQVVGSGVCLFAVLAAAMTVLLIAFAAPLSRLLHAPENAFSATVDYVRICAGGMVFVTAFNVLGSVFRGIGDSRLPLLTVAIACVVNIAGDLLLVAGFHMGAAGAAWATAFAQAVSVVLSLMIIRRRELPFAFSRGDIRFDRALIGGILRIGTPMALQDLLVSISFLVMMGIVNSLGLVQSAGVGVAEKLCAFIMLIPSAFMQAMSTFVAQNVGAGRIARADRGLAYGIAVSVAVGVGMFALSYFRGDMLSSIFARDPQVIAASAEYLRAYGIDCLMTAFLFCFIGYFSGMGCTLFVMIQGLIGAFFVRIPVGYLVSRMAGATLFQIGLATPASTLVQIALCGWYMFRLRRRR